MGPPLTAKKSVEKNVEKDPFLVTITNNNEEHSKVLVKAFNVDEQVKSSSNCLRLHTMSLIIGIFLMVLGLVCFAVSSYLESLFVHIVQGHTALSVGGPMFTAWLTPPIVPLLKVYVFNITNGAQVLQGEDPITQELGPYVYSATHIRTVAQGGEDSLAFLSRTNYQFQPHLSVGPESDSLTVLNMVMVTGFNKARSYLGMVKSGVVSPLLQSVGRARPVLTVTVGGFLFGYEDELACITDFNPTKEKTDISEADQEDDDWGDDDWDDEDWNFNDENNESDQILRLKRDIPSYRDPSGKCLWGILRDLNNTEHETIRINTGTEDFRQKGRIISVDGKESFGAWEQGSSCDRLKGSIEPSTLPAGLGSSFTLLVPVMCRNIAMVAQENFTIEGIDVTRYIADPQSLAQDSCYCPNSDTPCLPSGYLNLEPCYPDISPPMAVSFPHGLYSPPPQILTHPPSPNTTSHTMYMDINTRLGVPLAVQVPFQLSAVLRPDPYFPLLDRLNSTKLVPLFWASEGFEEPNMWMVANTRLALALPHAGAHGVAGGLVALGVCLLVGLSWTRRRGRT